jgi:hypothetical protein
VTLRRAAFAAAAVCGAVLAVASGQPERIVPALLRLLGHLS